MTNNVFRRQFIQMAEVVITQIGSLNTAYMLSLVPTGGDPDDSDVTAAWTNCLAGMAIMNSAAASLNEAIQKIKELPPT